jgi:hypothetical protein
VASLTACFAIFPPKVEAGPDRSEQLELVLRLYLAALEDLPAELLEAGVSDLLRTWAPSYGRTCPSPQELREAATRRARDSAALACAREAREEDARLARETVSPARLRELAAELDARGRAALPERGAPGARGATSGGRGVTLVWAVLAGMLRSGAAAAEAGIGRPKRPALTRGTGHTLESEAPGRGPGPTDGGS